MINEPDIWRAAALLLTEHGAAAAMVAAKRADKLLRDLDMHSYRVWERIFLALNEFSRGKPVRGDLIN